MARAHLISQSYYQNLDFTTCDLLYLCGIFDHRMTLLVAAARIVYKENSHTERENGVSLGKFQLHLSDNMTVWYVYLVWRRSTHEQGMNWGRFLLTFESRYVADEFYTTLCSLTTASGQPRFALLTRTAPQLWAFDSTQETGTGDDGWWWAPIFIWREPLFKDILKPFANRMIHTYLSDGNHSQRNPWPIITDQADGADWIDGGAFFIRNKRHRTRFWFDAGDGFVQVSTTMHTKFRVKRSAQSQNRPLVASGAKQVLVRSDVVQVSPIEYTGGVNRYIDIPINGKLLFSGILKTMKFGDFFSGLGSIWEASSTGGFKQYVTRMAQVDAGDEWELC